MIIYYEQVHDEGFIINEAFSFTEGDDKFDIKSFSGRIDKAGDAYVVTGKLNVTGA